MPLRVNSNLASNKVLRQLNLTTRAVDSGLERLASGLRINRAADDAAGLSVREGLRAELSGLQVNTRNAELANNLGQLHVDPATRAGGAILFQYALRF